ncbi:MAG TPA: hypothetical protein VKA86_03450 [Candidatus Krumholzibacteria bacterium]|nr:hypothetical protein [Candidatus Krumholzibacteria bacterium]
MSKRALLSLLVVTFAFTLGPVGCSDDDDIDDNGGLTGPITADVQLTCIECHTSEEALRATVSEEEDPHGGEGEAEGEG